MYDVESIRRLATGKYEHAANQREILKAAADILERENRADELRNRVTRHMEELAGWYTLSADAHKAIVEHVAHALEICAAEPKLPNGYAAQAAVPAVPRRQ